MLSFDPYATTTAADTFSVSTVGLIQGTVYDDPVARFALAGGVLDPAETLPMWGGVGICEDLNSLMSGAASPTLGNYIARAASIASTKPLTGFSVFNQAHAMVNSPSSPVPLAGSGGQVNFFRLGSGARLAVPCDAGLAALLSGDPVNTQVSWDFTGQLLVPYVAAYPQQNVSSISYNSTTGVVTLTFATSPGLAVNDGFYVSGITGITALNGPQVAITGTSGTTVEYQAAAGLIGTAAGGVLAAGGGALPVRVLEFDNNSMTVNYDSTTGNATWNRSGSAAVILL